MKNIFLFLLLIFANISFAQTTTIETTSNTTPKMTNTNTEEQRLEKWTKIMQYGVSSQRLEIIKKIRSERLSNNLPLLTNSFTNEKNRSVKEEMIYTFIDMQLNNAPFWEELFTNETDLIVLQRASYGVEQLEIPIGTAVYQKLIQYTNNPDAIRFNASAVRALGKLKHIESIPVITEFATNRTNNNDLRGAAVVALGMYQDPQLIPTLQNFLTNTIEPRLVRRYAALAIGRTKDPSAVDILKPIVTSEEEEQTIRLNAIEGLGYLPNEDTIKLMEELTKSDNTAMRTEAIKSLGRMKSTNSQALLEFKAFEDPETIVRREAKTALQELGIDITELEKKRKDPNYTPKSKDNNISSTNQ
ncbi:MAG: HEAT repeat domain-containing protein [Brevinema sp.]